MTIILLVMFVLLCLSMKKTHDLFERLKRSRAMAEHLNGKVLSLTAENVMLTVQQQQDAEEVDDHLTIKLAECADELIGVIDSLHGGKRIAKKLRKKYETRIVLKVKEQNPDEPVQDTADLEDWGGM
jgi:hypothetical protein